VTTSERNPVFSRDSFSIWAMALPRALPASSPDMPGWIAAFTLSVTSSIDIRTLSSRSVALTSSFCALA
jgi:hypothetical protein